VPSLALVGYTNAGKSTLFRALTHADAYVADQLFATLDPTVRRISLPGGTCVVVADTVGFIRELPHELVAAFQSTLTEAREATLLLHVVDAADARRDEHIAQVDEVLGQIGAGEIPQILVYNKIDRLGSPARIERDGEGRAAAAWISARDGIGLELLLQAVGERLARGLMRARVRLAPEAGAARSQLYAIKAVLGEKILEDGSMELAVALPEEGLRVLSRQQGVQILDALPPGSPCAPSEAYLQSEPSSAT
jgi:GTP-binding protein HflX